MKIKFQIGFTLVEVLVVIAVIGTVAAVVYGTFGPGIRRGRDAERKSDLAKYKLALENFASANDSSYPVARAPVRLSQFCVSYLSFYIPDCPEDARYAVDGSYTYNYQAMGTNPLDAPGAARGLRWVIWAKLETTAKIWVSCSNGKSAEVAAAGFTVTNANCPI